MRQVGEQFRELAFSTSYDRGHDDGLGSRVKREDVVGNLIGRLLFNDTAALGAMRDADAREQ